MEPTFQIGTHRVYRIEEWQGPFCPPEELFAEYESDAFAEQAGAFEPDYLREGAIYAFLQSWLIEADGQLVLVDTGAGNHKDRPGIPVFGDLETDFLDRFADTGFSPEQVDIVYCTHLHIDHVGWNTKRDASGNWVPAFPKAQYVFPSIERETWDPTGSAYAELSGATVNENVFEDSVQPILDAGLARLVDDGEEIAPGMTAHLAPGHTPGHMYLAVEKHGERALFTGDILHHPMQVIRPDWNSVYCEDRKQAAATRRHVLETAAATGARIVPAHFGGAHQIFIERDGEGYRPVPG